MADVTYTTVPSRVRPLLSKMREVGVPAKVTVQWLQSVGFKSSNDSTLIRVLKFIGFADTSGVPTPQWGRYRGNDHKTVLGEAIRAAYSELFKIYPNAHERPVSDIEHVFTTRSSGGKKVIANMVGTFRALAEQADFSGGTERGEAEAAAADVPATKAGKRTAVSSNSDPSLHIDIQVHISPESSPEQIDQIFASMARHLYPTRQ